MGAARRVRVGRVHHAVPLLVGEAPPVKSYAAAVLLLVAAYAVSLFALFWTFYK